MSGPGLPETPGIAPRRHVTPPFWRTLRGRRLLRDLVVVAGLALLGWVVGFLLLAPGPLLARDHAVPSVIGMKADAAERELRNAGFQPRRGDSRSHLTIDAGRIAWQDPPSETIAPEGTPVVLTLSDGLVQFPVPDVRALPLPVARRILEGGGFSVKRTDSLPAPGVPGTVLSTDPAAGTPRPAGSDVAITVRTAPAAPTPDGGSPP